MPKNSPEQIIDRPHDTGLRRGGTGTSTSTGATTFTALTDVPHSYAGEAGAVLVAKSDATGLEFGAVATATPTADAIPIAAGTGLIANGWLDATLASLAALGTVADRIAYTTALDTWAETPLTAFARTILDDASQAAVQTTLALVPGTNVQAYDATLLSIALLGTAADKMLYTTAIDTWAEAAITAAGRAILDDADNTAQRATLGLVIGTNVQAYDAELAAIAGLTSAADRLPYFTGLGTAALATFTSFGRSLADDADASAGRTTLGLVIGTNVQAYDATLLSIAALGTAADKMLYTTGIDTWAEAALTSYGRTLVALASATALRANINVADGADVTGAAITALATKTTPVDADAVVITDSAASDAPKRTLWSNIKATLKTYFDTLYGALATTNTWALTQTFSTRVDAPIVRANSAAGLRTEEDGGVLSTFVQDVTGFFGVKNTNPQATLDVIGSSNAARWMAIFAEFGITVENSAVISANQNNAITVQGDGAAYVNARDVTNDIEFLVGTSNAGVVFIGSMTDHPLVFRAGNGAGAGNVEYGRIVTGGNWGFGVTAATGKVSIQAGTSTGHANAGGVLYVSTATVGNVGTGEDTLASFSVPANTLAVNGQSLWFEAWGTQPNNLNTKMLRARFGSAGTNLFFSKSISEGAIATWFLRGRIYRTGAATQKGHASVFTSNAAEGDSSSALNQTLSGAVTFSITGEATANNDIVCEGFIVGWDDNHA